MCCMRSSSATARLSYKRLFTNKIAINMELNIYQTEAWKTCLESSNNVACIFFNLLGEVGELSEKIEAIITNKKEKRDLHKLVCLLKLYGERAKQIRMEPDTLETDERRHAFKRVRYTNDEQRMGLIKETGDIMWQLNGLMTVLGMDAEMVAQVNLDKLADRQERGQIYGDGDER